MLIRIVGQPPRGAERIRRKVVTISLLSLVTLMTSSCDRQAKVYERVRAQDTVEAYQEFLRRFPNGPLAKVAQERVIELDWSVAEAAKTVAALKVFIKKWPDTKWTAEANRRIMAIDWTYVSNQHNQQALAAFMNKWPQDARGAEFDGRITMMTEALAASRVIDLTVLEWFAWGPDQNVRRLTSQNIELLKQSAIEPKKKYKPQTVGFGGGTPVVNAITYYSEGDSNSEKVTVKRSGDKVSIRQSGSGPRYEFTSDWGRPYVTIGNRLPSVAFRNGAVSIANGEIVVAEDTEAKIRGELMPRANGLKDLVSSTSKDLIYISKNGRWSYVANDMGGIDTLDVTGHQQLQSATKPGGHTTKQVKPRLRRSRDK